jgi:hypothetical protein
MKLLRRVRQVLRMLRERLDMDVVFVSEFIDGKRVFRFVNTREGAPQIKPGESNPLEESVCQRIVDGRVPELVQDLGAIPADRLPAMPFRVGAHLSTPIDTYQSKVWAEPARRSRER